MFDREGMLETHLTTCAANHSFGTPFQLKYGCLALIASTLEEVDEEDMRRRRGRRRRRRRRWLQAEGGRALTKEKKGRGRGRRARSRC